MSASAGAGNLDQVSAKLRQVNRHFKKAAGAAQIG
jgi:hypothetical protein